MTDNEKGSATLHSLFAAVLLLTALAAATLWSTISTARHKLATAADLTALSAAQSLANPAATDASRTASGATTLGITGARTASDPPGPDLTTSNSTALNRTTPCAIAARIAGLHKVDLVACHPTPTSVTIQVSLDLRLPFTHPTLTTTARAGPL
ncbi:pilus assembly protein TadG-related protein [Kribbella sp. CWNU-51]